jgi:hypothetical protein
MDVGPDLRRIIFPPAARLIMRILPLILWGLVAASVSGAATIEEDFSSDPLQNGWEIFGDTNLFQWDSTNQDLDVTWDSSQTNSYFYHPLGTILAKSDSFSLAFDLELNDITWSGSPELAVGLFRLSDATNANFSRPAANTPNLFEFDYFPDNGVGQPAIVATLTDTNVSSANKKDFYFVYDNQPLNNGVVYHVVLMHNAGQTNISGQVSVGGQLYSDLPNAFAGPITDFRIDTVSISSYSNPANPLLAHGTVDNFAISLPPPPVQNLAGSFTNGVWQTQFLSQSNWLYTLQRSPDLQSWTNVTPATPGSATNLFLLDSNPPPAQAFYRINAQRP